MKEGYGCRKWDVMRCDATCRCGLKWTLIACNNDWEDGDGDEERVARGRKGKMQA